jgi:hypothetical protein
MWVCNGQRIPTIDGGTREMRQWEEKQKSMGTTLSVSRKRSGFLS